APDVQPGDHVDVKAQLKGVMALVLPDVLVLATPTLATPGSTAPVSGNYILRVSSVKAPKFAYIGEDGTYWLVVRPASGAKATPSFFVADSAAYATRRGCSVAARNGDPCRLRPRLR